MKILYHHRIRSKDGQSVHLEEIVGALRANGHQVLLVGPAGFATTSFGKSSGLIDTFKRLVPKPCYELMEIAYNIPSYFRLRRAWRQFHPDVVYERYNLYFFASVWLKKKTGCTVLLEVNAPLSRERLTHGGLAFPRLAQKIEKMVWRTVDFVLPVTKVLAEEIRQAGVCEKKIVVIPNAIAPHDFENVSSVAEAKASLGLAGKLVLGFTGFMREWHGLDAIVDWLASPAAPDAAHLLLVGDGPALAGLKEQALALGISSRMTCLGLIDRSNLSDVIQAFDIALQPKCVEYASPLKLFEYMALAKAIAAPDQENIREILRNGESALLFDPIRPDSMAKTIAELCEDHALRERLGHNARLIIEREKFTWSENAQRIVTLAENTQRRHQLR